MAANWAGDKSYLIYMAIRLLEMKRLLKSTGFIFLHCDPAMSYYLKMAMDAIFRKGNLRNEFTWQRHSILAKGSQHAPRAWDNTTDTILFFAESKTELRPYRSMTESERSVQFPLVDATGQRNYVISAYTWRTPKMGTRPNQCYKRRRFTIPHPSGRRLSKERLEEEFEKGNYAIEENGKLQRQKYERDYSGKQAGSLRMDIPIPLGKERTGYLIQKPFALLCRNLRHPPARVTLYLIFIVDEQRLVWHRCPSS